MADRSRTVANIRPASRRGRRLLRGAPLCVVLLAPAAPASDAYLASARHPAAGDGRVDDGARLWAQLGCPACHGAGTEGAPARPLAGLASRYSLHGLAAFLRDPGPAMPPVPLGDTEREALAAYLLAAHP